MKSCTEIGKERKYLKSCMDMIDTNSLIWTHSRISATFISAIGRQTGLSANTTFHCRHIAYMRTSIFFGYNKDFLNLHLHCVIFCGLSYENKSGSFLRRAGTALKIAIYAKIPCDKFWGPLESKVWNGFIICISIHVSVHWWEKHSATFFWDSFSK